MAEGGLPNGNHDDSDFGNDFPDDDEKPDDIKKVERETEVVFRDFLYRRLKSRNGFEDSDMSVANIPPMDTLDDLKERNEEKLDNQEKEKYEQLGRQLAQFGDVIQNKYKDQFERLISDLNLAEDLDFGFDKFCSLAQRLFDNGINWGRIVALLCFGYQIAVTVIKRGTCEIKKFLKKIVTSVVKFLLMQEKIIRWILQQGGWLVGFVTGLGSSTENDRQVWIKRVSAAAVLAALCYGFYRYGPK